MAQLTLPFSPDDIRLPVFVGVDHPTTVSAVAAGQPVPRPVMGNAVIDTGTNITGVSLHLLRQLGLVAVRSHTTQTAGGSAAVDLYMVSLGIPPIAGLT